MSLTRIEIQDRLELVDSNLHVYYQPAASVRLTYPAIVYRVNDYSQNWADDYLYKKDRSYLITLIHYDPDNDIVEKLLWAFPKLRFDRTYTSDNLYHYVYVLYE
jgi:hypothetical protein